MSITDPKEQNSDAPVDALELLHSVTHGLVGSLFRVAPEAPYRVQYWKSTDDAAQDAASLEAAPAPASLCDHVEPQDHPTLDDLIERAGSENGVATAVVRLRTASETAVWVQAQARAVRDAAGDLVGIDGCLFDISELKRRDSIGQRAWIALGQSSDETYWFDKDGAFTYANAAACHNLGYSEPELLRMRLFDIAPNQAAADWPEYWKRLCKQRGDQYETAHRDRNGRLYPVELNITLVEFEGELFGFAYAHDISARKSHEAIVRASEERTRAAYDEIKELRDQLQAENILLRKEVKAATGQQHLVGNSPAIVSLREQIEMVAPTDSTVLILGESGTGKSLVAQEIHELGNRADQPIVRVNCASIPEELYESEFFGHIKGAFTGAQKDRAGRFELAHGGTLFLDEVGEIPLALQGKLLRVLQEGQYERVGEGVSRTVDVRLIAATNRDLKQEVEEGRFRRDLYYRLNVFPIEATPLRDRLEDVPLLVAHMLPTITRRMNRAVPELTRANIHTLLSYSWPGNVRELQNVVERAVITTSGPVLRFDLPDNEPPRPAATAPRTAAAATIDDSSNYLTEIEMRKKERDNTLAVLEAADWRVFGRDGAAEKLGIKASTLMSRMKRMKLQRPSKPNR